ncbi:VOC family protein [Levilactobacillus huananensis]|uniref:hypothetical protein n=1 Tax=Levilactobacillus huananensis TaxID=2486019 RepID=UPI001CDC7B44|nr:hypothetical protein [Levilactobacillus huananensis]
MEAMAIHVGFSVLETSLQCADAFRGTPIPSNQVDLILDVNAADATSAAAANAFYQCVVASQTVIMEIPFERQFWGGKMGHFTDRYGISWILHVMSWRQIKDPTAQ